jgi:hypothetical protein
MRVLFLLTDLLEGRTDNTTIFSSRRIIIRAQKYQNCYVKEAEVGGDSNGGGISSVGGGSSPPQPSTVS